MTAMQKNRYRDIPLLKPYLGPEEMAAVEEVLRSTWLCGDGPKGRELEEAVAHYLGVRFALLTTNCTSAMHLALMSLGIDDGEAVIPNYTFTSTGLAPVLAGCKPVLCEVDYATANIDVFSLRERISEKTRVILPVHYAGLPCDMDEILALAEEFNLSVVEDAAQALGATYRGRHAGTFGDVGCFSFHSVKNVTCGEGGIMVTDDEEVYKRARVMRDKGTDKYSFDLKKSEGFYEYVSLGHNYMLSDILAAIALVQFKKLETINGLRKKHAEYLLRGLAGTEGLILPRVYEDRQSNWNLFTVKTSEGKAQPFIDEMRTYGVVTNRHYIPLHMNRFYESFGYRGGAFPASEKLSDSLVRLPLYPGLVTDDLDHIIYSARQTMKSMST
jgi:dTDP-4-amino-4,6-dideoxygalactose transaminase